MPPCPSAWTRISRQTGTPPQPVIAEVRVPPSTPRDVEAGYAAWGESLVAAGWDAYLLTFMFRHLRGSDLSVYGQMEREVIRVYATLLPRIVRKPCAPSSVERLPVWFCAPDLPVFKRARQGRLDVLVNEGRHMHATGFLPPWSRLREDLATHFDRHRDLYVRPGQGLIRIDAEPITHCVGYVVGYARKLIAGERVSGDATLILPRSRSEMKDRWNQA